jgi:hypothetical protein
MATTLKKPEGFPTAAQRQATDSDIRLGVLTIAADRLMAAAQIHDADAVVALAKRFETYVQDGK